MELLNHLALGFGVAMTPINLLYALIGSLVGTLIGALVSRVRVLRAAFGSLITGLQTMPSIAWFPLAVLLFKGGECLTALGLSGGRAGGSAWAAASGVPGMCSRG